MEPIEDIDQLREVIKPLAERKLVVYLTPQGRRGTTLTHGFHAPEELARLKAFHSTGIAVEEVPSTPTPKPVVAPVVPPPPAPDVVARLEARLAEACIEINRQKTKIQGMKADMTQLRELLNKLQQELGITT